MAEENKNIPTLRYYQRSMVDAFEENLKIGKPDNLGVMPTGGGKSVVMAAACQKLLTRKPTARILALSHRKELDTQNEEKFRELNPGFKTGFERGKVVCKEDASIMFASVQSVGREGLERIKRWSNLEDIDLLLIDEAHHVPGGKTYQTVLNELRAANPNLAVLALTATPERADGLRLADWIGNLLPSVEIDELIQAGYLANLEAVTVKTETSMEEFIGDEGEDFNEAKLEQKVNNPARNALAVALYKEHHSGEKSMVFCTNKNHAWSVEETFRQSGIKAKAITEDTPPKERESLKKDVRSGKIDVVITVTALTEGFDLPEIKSLFVLRPTKSPVLQAQLLGRGMRLVFGTNPETGEVEIRFELKDHCKVYDFVDLKAHEAGARTLSDYADLPEDLEVTGNLAELKKITELISENPFLIGTGAHGAALAAAKTPEELMRLLHPINLLEKLKLIKPNEETEMPWMMGPKHTQVLCLSKGEICRISRNPLGQFILETDHIDLPGRVVARNAWRAKHSQFKKPQLPIPAPLKAATHVLKAKTLTQAYHEAEKILAPVLELDNPMINQNASWRRNGQNMGITPDQKGVLIEKLLFDESEFKRMTKTEAAQAINLSIIKENTLRATGKMPMGRYEGIDIKLLAVRKPQHLRDQIENGKAKKYRVQGQIQTALQENPLTWLKETHRGIYYRYLEPQLAELNALHQTNPDALREKISQALDRDPTSPWKSILKVSQERAQIADRRMAEQKTGKYAPNQGWSHQPNQSWRTQSQPVI